METVVQVDEPNRHHERAELVLTVVSHRLFPDLIRDGIGAIALVGPARLHKRDGVEARDPQRGTLSRVSRS